MKTAIPLSQLLRPVEPTAKQAVPARDKASTTTKTTGQSGDACDNTSLRRLDPGQIRHSVGRGEAEARLLFAKAQMPQRPLSTLLAQANVDGGTAARLLE